MEVRVITADAAEVVPASQLAQALADPDALVWVDIPEGDAQAVALLRDTFRFHPIAVNACMERQRMPKVHAYPDYVFLVLHTPELGQAGHVHYVEIDQFIGRQYLVTIHGPTNPAVPTDVPLNHTRAVWARILAGRFRPVTPMQVLHAIVGSMTRAMEETLESVTEQVWALEQRVTAGQMGDPETFLDEMFRTRHALLAVANISAGALQIQQRMAVVGQSLDPGDQVLLADSLDEYDRVHRLAENQREYLQGVIEFYRTRTDTKMTVAAERLAVIAVVTLPITALASILGMNVIVNDRTQGSQLGIAIVLMLVMSGFLLRWARRHGWW